MPLKANIHFFFHQSSIRLPDRTKLKSFINEIFKKEGEKPGSLNYIFCSDKDLLKINKKFLGHNFYTDIITFNLSEINSSIEAEIYISTDRVKENSKSQKSSFKQELLRVVFHGVLHLCGYSDKSPYQQRKMREKEDEYLLKYSKFHMKTYKLP